MSSLIALSNSQSADINQLSGLYKACSDELRLEILRVLKTDSYGVLELGEIFNIKQSGMSHHLKVLATQKLVTTRREGNSIFYSRTLPNDDSILSQSIRELFQQIDRLELRPESKEQISKVKQQRARLGKAFFSKHVDKFREQQELIALYEQYFSGSLDLLSAAKSPNKKTVLELGPGDGQFLAELSPRFDKVIALDYSNEMLNKAKAFALSAGLNNIDFILGETNQAIEKNIKADAIILNMVLHHLPSPSDCFNDLSRLLEKDGVIIIADLCYHEQSWAQEACGDLWLGFKEEDLKNWARQAGLAFAESSYLGLRNGFQILFCSFKKEQDTNK